MLSRYALALTLVMLPTVARAADVAVGVRVGTTGIGPEVDVGLGDRAELRAILAGYSYDRTFDKTGIRYDATLELRHVLMVTDWHPTGGSFRLSAGAGWNDDRLKVKAPLSELVRRERPDLLPLVPANLGTIHGEATAGSSLAPYAGFGWGLPFGSGRWSTSFDVGALYLGKPDVHLAIDSPLLADAPPSVRETVRLVAADEEGRLEHELDSYRYLPVVSFGVGVRF